MNPYSFIDPVTDPRMFFGYRDELEKIISRVSAPKQERLSYFVAGAWRMGKTSLLLQAERRLRRMGPERQINGYRQVLIPIYLDTLRLGDATSKGFFGVAARLLACYLADISLHFDVPPQVTTHLEAVETASDPLRAFENGIHSLAEAARPRQLRVVLLIDELGRLMRREAGEVVTLQLRALHIVPAIEHILAYVITGSQRDLWRISKTGSPLQNILVIQRLHVFDEEQSLELINKPTEGQVPPEVAEQVCLESGGHPFLLQYLMSVLCEHENLRQLTAEDVLQATRRFSQQRRDFQHWWEGLGEPDRIVYGTFYREKRRTVEELSRMMLSVPSPAGEGRKTVLDTGMLRDSLDVLQTTGLIRELAHGVYELAGKMFARWFHQTVQCSF